MALAQRSRSTYIVGERISGAAFKVDVIGWSTERVRDTLRVVATENLEAQKAMGNPATAIFVDNQAGKSVLQAETKVVALFGFSIGRAVVSAIENTLSSAIASTTDIRTGALRDVGNSWTWTYVPSRNSGRGAARTVNPEELPGIYPGDMLILSPKLEYATQVNSLVAQGKRSISLRLSKKDSTRLKKARRNTGMGFLGATAAILRRLPSISKNFWVGVSFSSSFALSKEPYAPGGQKRTGRIILKLKGR